MPFIKYSFIKREKRGKSGRDKMLYNCKLCMKYNICEWKVRNQPMYDVCIYFSWEYIYFNSILKKQ